ncbi:MAG: ABC transporter permease [Clostridia bacterium]|nr:ABC transporter permease [Clostridia bacterium]
MRLLLKNMLGVIRRRPSQPILLILTLILSITISVFSLSVREALGSENELRQSAKYGEADFTVTIPSGADSRFMFADSVEQILAGEAVAVGSYELPVLLGEGQGSVFAAAADLTDLSEIFSLRFSEYTPPTVSAVGEAAFISRALARSEGIALGDEISLRAFGEEGRYTVYGISEARFFDSTDILVDISGVVRMMTSGSPLISALGDGFKPSGTVYVKTVGDRSAEECIAALRMSEELSDKSFTAVKGAEESAANTRALSTVVDIFIFLSAVLGGAVIICSLFVLSLERREGNAILAAAGVEHRVINLLLLLEISAYWLIAIAPAALLSLPLCKLFFTYAGFEYASFSLNFGSLALGALYILLSALISLFIFLLSFGERKKQTKAKTALPIFLSLGLFCAFTVGTFTLAYRARFIFSVLAVAVSLLLVFLLSPRLLLLFAALAERWEKRRSGRAPRLYAAKNLRRLKILHNTASLTALLTSVVLTALFVITGASRSVETARSLFSADYGILNASEVSEERIESAEGVERTFDAYLGSTVADGLSLPVISVEDEAALSGHFDINGLPEGAGAVISRGAARMLSLRTGDSFTVTLDGAPLELVLSDIADTGFTFILIDASHFGLRPNMLLVAGEAGVGDGELLDSLTRSTALELVSVVSVEDMLKSKTRSLEVYLGTAGIFLIFILVFSLIGILNNLIESYLARREELSLFTVCGMTRSEVRKMKAREILATLLTGLLLGLISLPIIAIILNEGLYSYAMEALTGFFGLLR